MIALLLGEAITLFLLIRDNILPDDWSKQLRLWNIPIPHLTLWQWATISAVLFTLFILEGAYRLVRDERRIASRSVAKLEAELKGSGAELVALRAAGYAEHINSLRAVLAKPTDPIASMEEGFLWAALEEHVPRNQIWGCRKTYQTLRDEQWRLVKELQDKVNAELEVRGLNYAASAVLGGRWQGQAPEDFPAGEWSVTQDRMLRCNGYAIAEVKSCEDIRQAFAAFMTLWIDIPSWPSVARLEEIRSVIIEVSQIIKVEAIHLRLRAPLGGSCGLCAVKP